MTRCFTKVADELLPELRSDLMPAELHLIAEIGPSDPGMTLVEFEDDEAPAELAGCTVCPVVQAEYRDGKVVRTRVLERYVEARP